MKQPALLRLRRRNLPGWLTANTVFVRLALIVALLTGLLPISRANHLVGSEWRMQALGNEQFRVRLTVYTDPVGGGGNSFGDPTVTIAAYAKGSAGNPDLLTATYVLPRISGRGLPNAGAACSQLNVPVEELVYEAVLTLSASQFGNSRGYYLAWERCCRNQILTNITTGENEGLVAVLQFPGRYTSSGALVSNSAPQFGPVPRAVALCRGEPASIAFGATDADRDSLVYALVAPLAGYTTPLSPIATLANPAPYPPVRYAGSYSAAQPFGGSFQLNPRTGELRGTAVQPGTYAVAVAVREYRFGLLIGENRRDIELSVTECPPNAQPRLTRLTPPAPPDTVRITGRDDRCLTLAAFDPDAGQTLTVRVLGAAPVSISPSIVTMPFPPAPAVLNVCWNDCALPARQTLTLVVQDDGCRTLFPDTLRIPIRVIPAPNTRPVITRLPPLPDTLTVSAGQPLTLAAEARDSDLDSLTLQLRAGNGPDLPTATVRGAGTARLSVVWVPPCEAARVAPYELWFRASDGQCIAATDSMRVLVRVVGGTATPNLPNIITPDGDGRNDCFSLSSATAAAGACADDFTEVSIFTRWGRRVYTATDSTFCWNAPDLISGTYYYLIRRTRSTLRGWLEVVR